MAIPELQDSSGRLTDCIYFGDPISANIGSGFVPTARTISTTAPLTGGGDLSANRTFAISAFAGSTPGSVPTSAGGVVTFLRADGAWATPPTFGAAAVGYAPASGGGSTNFLRADGTWAAPAGTGISGLTTNWYPVATSATAIGNGRITQSAGALTFYTTYTGASDYNSLAITEDTSLRVVTPATVTGFGPDSVGLRLQSVRMAGGASYLDVFDARITAYGLLSFSECGTVLANGLNSSVAPTNAPELRSFCRATGPTAAFSIGGIVYGTEAGSYFVLYNTTSQQMTIVDEDPSATLTTRITTGTGANVLIPGGPSAATFIYSGTDSRWLLVATNPAVEYPRTLGYIPYQNSGGDLADSTLFHDSANNRYGFATATPYATVDINGTLATRSYNQALSNGLNSDIPAPTTSFMRITGPTGAFSVGGVTIVTGENGKRLTIHNTTAQAMTIIHEDASSTAANRINTLTAASVVFPARQSVIHLIYSTTTSRWILDEANANTAGGATTQVQHNLAGSLSGDTGLVVAGTGVTKTLTIGTDVTLARKTTSHLQLGASAAATGAYTLTGQSSIGGTDTNKIGGTLMVGGGAGTGTAGGGDTALITAPPLTTGNTQTPHFMRLIYAAKPVPLTDSSATLVATVEVPTETGSGGTLWYTIYCTDLTDMQIRRGRVEWGAVNKASAVTIVLGTPEEVDCTPVGTLTVTVTAVDSTADSVLFNLNAVSSLTPPAPTDFVAWISLEHDGRGAIVTA